MAKEKDRPRGLPSLFLNPFPELLRYQEEGAADDDNAVSCRPLIVSSTDRRDGQERIPKLERLFFSAVFIVLLGCKKLFLFLTVHFSCAKIFLR